MTDIDFSEVGPAYTWRFPYFAKFFEQIAIAAELNDKSFVLDLACGTGELAVGMSPYCGEVLGIDKSQEMLSLRRELPANVRFLQGRPPIGVHKHPAPRFAGDHRTRHPLSRPKRRDAVPGVCGRGTGPRAGLCGRYVQSRSLASAIQSSVRPLPEAQGRAGIRLVRLFFANSRWKEGRTIEIRGTFRCRPEGIFRNALSHENLSEGILADQERFLLELRQILAPYQDAAGIITFARHKLGRGVSLR